jgi:S1-C subfamily serine protease
MQKPLNEYKAIPINELKPAIESVEKFGKIVRPFLGVRYTELTPEIAKSLELKTEYGAFIQDDINTGTKAVVKDSPAEKAGIKSGDIITAVNSKKIDKDNGLNSIIQDFKVGDTITITILATCTEVL